MDDDMYNDSFDTILASIDMPNTSNNDIGKKDDATTTAGKDAPKKTASEECSSSTSSNDQNVYSEITVKRNISSNSILVNPKQRGNPLLKSITSVTWEYQDIIPDFVIGKIGILFISIQYHNLFPEYLFNRLKALDKMFELRVLLVQVDTKDPTKALKNLTRICFLTNLTLMLAWNPEEAGKIVETYKLFENKPPDLIMERAEQFPHQKLVSALTNIKPVNKTDAMILLQNYGNLESLINSSEDKLSQCSGLGPRKAKKLHQIFNEPFLSPPANK